MAANNIEESDDELTDILLVEPREVKIRCEAFKDGLNII